uniref:Uncharacterized protein n=1 Tax=Bursaphelenchus xylophilus TaxID=6326 RepID=A0A1I7RXH1_BURXY
MSAQCAVVPEVCRAAPCKIHGALRPRTVQKDRFQKGKQCTVRSSRALRQIFIVRHLVATPNSCARTEKSSTEKERSGLGGRKFDEPLGPEKIVTVAGCLRYIFDTLEEIYVNGTTEVKG